MKHSRDAAVATVYMEYEQNRKIDEMRLQWSPSGMARGCSEMIAIVRKCNDFTLISDVLGTCVRMAVCSAR